MTRWVCHSIFSCPTVDFLSTHGLQKHSILLPSWRKASIWQPQEATQTPRNGSLEKLIFCLLQVGATVDGSFRQISKVHHYWILFCGTKVQFPTFLRCLMVTLSWPCTDSRLDSTLQRTRCPLCWGSGLGIALELGRVWVGSYPVARSRGTYLETLGCRRGGSRPGAFARSAVSLNDEKKKYVSFEPFQPQYIRDLYCWIRFT